MTSLLKKRINPARRIAVGFAILIFIGAFLLMLPVSSKTGRSTPFLTALFTSASATCVTGLSLVNVGAYFSVLGQIIILMLIQIGGLGFMTVLCFGFFITNKYIGLRNRMLIAQSMGMGTLEGVVKLAKHVLMITAVVELAGAVLLSVRFVPQYGIFKGIWASVFHSVSAFCNAGFDIIGDGQSMMSYRDDPMVLLVLAALIIIGGLGFIVWEDILRKRKWKKLTMYSKTVLLATAFFLVVGTIVYLGLEYNNPDTLANSSIIQKIIASFFQSVTTRTAGFDAVGQYNLSPASKAWSIILMMIGGASGSTAGGVKVGTILLVFVTLHTVLRARSEVVIFGRRIGYTTIVHAMALLVLWLILVTAGTVIISLADTQPMLDAMYETASAYSTVGLTVGITESASVLTKILLILYMFFGRVGIMTISLVFMSRSTKLNGIKYPDGEFLVG